MTKRSKLQVTHFYNKFVITGAVKERNPHFVKMDEIVAEILRFLLFSRWRLSAINFINFNFMPGFEKPICRHVGFSKI